MVCPHPKTWNLIGELPYHCWLLPKKARFKAKFVKATFFQNYLAFFKKRNIVFGKRNGKVHYSEPSVKLKLLQLPNKMKTDPELGSLLRISNPSVRLTSMEISFCWSLQQQSRWDREKWMRDTGAQPGIFQGTSMNNSSKTYDRKASQGKIRSLISVKLHSLDKFHHQFHYIRPYFYKSLTWKSLYLSRI